MLEALLAEARDDDNVAGVVLFGSRGKGAFVTASSDWDVFVVVREHRGDRPFVHGAQLETVEVTVDELRNLPAWNRYSLTWLEPQLDKTGEVAAALRDALRVDPATAGEPLDGYVNSGEVIPRQRMVLASAEGKVQEGNPAVPLVEELVVVHVHLDEDVLFARIEDRRRPVLARIRADRAEVAPDAHHRELVRIAERRARIAGEQPLRLRQLRDRRFPDEPLPVGVSPRLDAGSKDTDDGRHVSAGS